MAAAGVARPAVAHAAARPGEQRAALVLMLASGLAGLGCQIVWTQQATLWLGHDTAAVLAVVAAFFGGLAVGALALGGRIRHSARPGRWYVGCELLIALWSLLLLALMAPAASALLVVMGAQPAPAWQWAVAFCGTFLLLLPATAAIGATLPALDAVLHRPAADGAAAPSAVAALYAANTAGAVLGVLAAAFWLVPAFGLRATALVCVALNLLCGALAARWWLGDQAPAAPAVPAAGSGRKPVLLWLLAATGALGIGQEVLVVRALSQVAENTVYTFAMLLALYLLGTALGAAAYQRWWASAVLPPAAVRSLLAALLALLGLACVLGDASLWWADSVKAAVLDALGPSLGAALAAEALLAALAFLPPTLVMGALFSHLLLCARAAGVHLGRALGANTLGAAVAPAVFGVWLLPALGSKAVLLGVAAAYLLLALPLVWRSGRTRFSLSATALGALGVLGLALLAPPLRHVQLPDGASLVGWHEGAMAAVSVTEDSAGVRRLHINNRQQEGDSHSRLADGRQALLPLLLHPAPQRALFLGLGTGITAATAADDRALQVQAVELLPEVIAAAAHFNAAVGPAAPPNLQVLAADARRYVRAAGPLVDLVVSDNFHPARSGSAALYTVAHFRAVQQRLAPGGVFCQWLPLHQLDHDSLRSIVQSFLAVYPGGGALLATLSLDTPVLGLVSRRDGEAFDVAALRQRLASARPPLQPAAYGIDDEWALLGSLVAGPKALARLAGDAPLNTDDHPVVAYRASALVYSATSTPRERLLALLPMLALADGELLQAPPAEPPWPARLAAYQAARQQFMQAGRSVVPNADAALMLAQVRAPLLAVLATSADFRPAYAPLLRLAAALAHSDPSAARALLAELARLQPARPEAAALLATLGPG